MAFKMPHIGVIVGLVAAGIALLFQIIAVAAVGWIKLKAYGIYDATLGLWKSCVSGVCIDIPSEGVAAWFQATRAFGLLGLLFIAFALVVGILSMFIDNKFLPSIAGGLVGIAGSCVLISFAVFAGKAKSAYSVFDLSYCFALSVVAFVLCIVCNACFFVSKFVGGSSS